jgi:hypothetical protein
MTIQNARPHPPLQPFVHMSLLGEALGHLPCARVNRSPGAGCPETRFLEQQETKIAIKDATITRISTSS